MAPASKGALLNIHYYYYYYYDDMIVTFSTMMENTPYGNMTIYPVKHESGVIAEDDMLPMTWSPAQMVPSPIYMRLSMYLQQ